MTIATTHRDDEARNKGATEDGDSLGGSFTGQLGHRDQDEMLKDNDTDFPEPDAHGEISGK